MILMKDIIREGDERLHEKALPVGLPLSKEDEETLRLMKEYLDNSIDPDISKQYGLRAGVGLAAVQLGILKQMIAISAPDERGVEHQMLLINPRLLSYSDELTYLEGGEGCLSVDRECDAIILRPKRISFEAYFYDYDTKEIEKKILKLKGYLAVVFQHEYDHLQGILFVDRVNQNDPYFIPENASPIKFKGE